MFAKLPARYPEDPRASSGSTRVERGIDFALETSPTALRAFATGIRRRLYVANGYGGLAESPIRPPR